MHIKVHVRTSKLAKFFRGCIHVPRFNRGGSENGERAWSREKERRGKGKVEGMTEGRGRKEGMGNSDGGNCATAPRGDRRHCWPPLALALFRQPEPASETRYHCMSPLPHRWLYIHSILNFTCFISPSLDFPPVCLLSGPCSVCCHLGHWLIGWNSIM